MRWLLLLAITLARSPGLLFDVLNIDEVDFALIGRSVLEGHLPYSRLVDIKPPLTYVAFAPAALFGKLSLLPMHVLGILIVFATALVLERVAKSPAAPWIYFLATLCEVPSVNSELLLNLPTALALLCFVEERDWLAGLCIGLASLFKHQGAMPLISLGLVLLMNRRFSRGAKMSLGFALPWAITFGVYAFAHDLPQLWDWCFARNFGYVGKTSGAMPRFLSSTLLCCGVALMPWYWSIRESLAKRADPFVIALWLTWIPVAMGGRFYEHYYLQFAPFLAVVAAPRASLKRALLWVPALVAVAYFFVHRYPSQEPKLREVAQFLRQRTRPDEQLFVWGHSSPIYYFAERRPGTRYATCSVHVGNFDPAQLPPGFDARDFVSERDVEATLVDLEQNKPAIFVDLAPSGIHNWDKLPLSTVPALDRYIHDHYAQFGTAAGAAIYRRKM
jgi:hypothetical protein